MSDIVERLANAAAKRDRIDGKGVSEASAAPRIYIAGDYPLDASACASSPHCPILTQKF